VVRNRTYSAVRRRFLSGGVEAPFSLIDGETAFLPVIVRGDDCVVQAALQGGLHDGGAW